MNKISKNYPSFVLSLSRVLQIRVSAYEIGTISLYAVDPFSVLMSQKCQVFAKDSSFQGFSTLEIFVPKCSSA